MPQKKYRMPLWFAIPAWIAVIATIIYFSRPTQEKTPPKRQKSYIQEELDRQLYRDIENDPDSKKQQKRI